MPITSGRNPDLMAFGKKEKSQSLPWCKASRRRGDEMGGGSSRYRGDEPSQKPVAAVVTIPINRP